VSTNETSGNSPPASDEVWWRSAVIYEIAAISFQDSNGDGQGDLPGLLQRIDYLNWLGVGDVWLTPIYSSPNHDFGYDIADFAPSILVSAHWKISMKFCARYTIAA
jgi:alpha-glucosidase